MTNNFNVVQAREIYNSLCRNEINNNTILTEEKEALLFTKALHIQLYGPKTVFCEDNQFFISKTPTGYAVAGFCSEENETKHSVNITVIKNNGLWGVASTYVSPDTKAVSSSVALWVILMMGSALIGLISYLVLKASIGF